MTETLLADFNAALARLLVPTEVAVPTFNYAGNGVRLYDAQAVGAGIVHVVAEMAVAPAQTTAVRYITKNGTAKEGYDFDRAAGWVVFHPGEQRKMIPVRVRRDLADRTFTLEITETPATPPTPRTVGRATISAAVPAAPAVTGHGSVSLPLWPADVPVEWETDFSSVAYSDAGGPGIWRNQLAHGRYQNNGEVGYYVPDGFTGRDADGFFIEASEGVTVAPDGRPWTHRAGILTTQRMPEVSCREGTIVEVVAKCEVVQGAWPAIWLMPHDLSRFSWPAKEIDLMEGFFSTSDAATNGRRYGTTVHWRTPTGGHSSYGSLVRHVAFDPAGWNAWGCWQRPDGIVFYLNRQPYFAVPNVWPAEASCYLKLNIAVGGQGGTPQPGFRSKMWLQRATVFRAGA